ncbi:hypothetical protein C8A03DRAFT_37073 [Achaetomium macrosporum]|uniref:Protein kinase domain-containing protein n=1 Tax=Achaetomium macrosporum TaxID=79813 RepID=A0AAN7H8G7_9PEZI|nr:hypothetical protein C8A03DRAFT_37073 [Achaetomium macrosporum]
MAYSPTEHGHLYNGMQPPFMERINPEEEKQFVHFDIDPQNVLVGDPGLDQDHPLLPVFKMGDFGLAKVISPRSFLEPDTPWFYRALGKFSFYTPFSAEWDYIPLGRGPLSLKKPWSVAGKFFWTHNLFQIGLVMACLMARKYPLVPPFPQRMWAHTGPADTDDDDKGQERGVRMQRKKEQFHHQKPEDLEEEAFAGLTALYQWNAYATARRARSRRAKEDPLEPDSGMDTSDEDDDISVVNNDDYDREEIDAGDAKRVWSYGAYFLNDENLNTRAVDRYLRMLVARCLCDQPQDRPRLAWLKEEVEGYIRHRQWPAAQNDAAIKEWMEKMKW